MPVWGRSSLDFDFTVDHKIGVKETANLVLAPDIQL